MKNPRKVLAITAVVLAIAAVGLVRAINLLLAQNRDQVRQELEKVIGKAVRFGSLEVVWFGRPGFVAKGFRIADDPRFAATPLIRARELTLGISLWNLFFHRLVINRLAFSEPELQIITNETGSLNLTTLLERRTELREFPTLRPALPDRRHAVIDFSIGQVEIKDGRVEYIDRSIKEPAELRINHLSMTLKGFDPSDALKIRLTASLTEGLSQDLRIDGQFDPAPNAVTWTDRAINLTFQFDSLYVPVVAHAIAGLRNKIPSELDVTGPMALKATAVGTARRPRLENITLKVPLFGSSDYNATATGSVAFSERRSWDDARIKGELVMKPLALARLTQLKSLEGILPAGLATNGSIGVYMAFEGTWDNLRIGALLRADKAELRYKESLRKPADMPAAIQAKIYRQQDQLLFRDAALIVDGNRIGFSGALVYGSTPRLRLDLTGKQNSLAAWSGLFAAFDFAALTGKAEWHLTLDKSLLRPDENWSLQGQLNLRGAEFAHKQSREKVSNVDARISFAGQQARFDQVSFRIGRSTMSLEGIAANITEPRATYILRSAYLNLAELPLLVSGPPVQLENFDAKGEIQLENDRLVLTGLVTAPRAALYNLRLQNLRSEVAVTALAFTFKNLSAQVLNGIVHSDGYWTSAGGRLQQLDFFSKVDGVEIHPLLAELFPPLTDRFEGRLHGEARLAAVQAENRSIKNALNGSGEARVQNGVVKDFNLISQLLLKGSGTGAASAARLPSGLAGVIARQDTAFDSLTASFTIEQGRVRTDNLLIVTPEYTITGAGWIGFDRSTNWNGLLVFSPRLSQEFQREYKIIRYLLDRRGRLAISFRLDGKIPNLRIRLDNRALAQALRTGSSGRSDEEDSDAQPAQEPKQTKRWIPDALERFLNR